jgi:hypothetical protein
MVLTVATAMAEAVLLRPLLGNTHGSIGMYGSNYYVATSPSPNQGKTKQKHITNNGSYTTNGVGSPQAPEQVLVRLCPCLVSLVHGVSSVCGLVGVHSIHSYTVR